MSEYISMGIWRSIFGWDALFKWDVLGVIVPGIFFAGGLGVLGIDWLPHNLLIAQICLGLCIFLVTIKIIRHAVESHGSAKSRFVFAAILSSCVMTLGILVVATIQKHKDEKIAASSALSTPINPLPKIDQKAKDSECANIIAGGDVQCSPSEKKHAKP